MSVDYPKTFKDGAGREWTVNLSLASSVRIKDLTGKKIDDFIPKSGASSAQQLQPFRDFISDPFAVFDLFYALIKLDADKIGLSKEQVVEGFTTDESVESMTFAVVQTIVDFFRQRDPSRAMILKRYLDMGKQVMDRATKQVQTKMEAIDIDAIVDAAVDQIDPAKITAEAVERLKKSAASTAES